MTEKSENEQHAEIPEQSGHQDASDVTASEENLGGYRESEEHVPDPTAMSGTLETSGTGGGHNERLTGTTRIFGDAEEVTRKVESLIGERIQSLQEEVRSLLLQQEATAQTQNTPQQTVEEHGLPSHQGNIIAPNNDTGAAQDAARSGNVGTGAGSPDDVSEGITYVEDPAQPTSYNEQVIAGAQDPNKGSKETPESEGDKEKAEEEKTTAKKPAAKKTTPPKK